MVLWMVRSGGDYGNHEIRDSDKRTLSPSQIQEQIPFRGLSELHDCSARSHALRIASDSYPVPAPSAHVF